METSQVPESHTNSNGEEIRKRRAGEEKAMAASEELETLSNSDGEGEGVRKRRANDGDEVRGERGNEERATATSEELENRTNSNGEGEGVRKRRGTGEELAMASSGDRGIGSISDGEGMRRRRIAGDGESATESSARAVVRHENPFYFWLAFTSTISLLTLLLTITAPLLTRRHSIELLAMPPRVRAHFEAGKLLKVEVGENQIPAKAFVRGSTSRGETVLLLSGIGSSSFLYRTVVPLLDRHEIAAVAVDLPGAGLAEKTRELKEEEPELGFLGARYAALKELLVEGFSPRAEENEFLANMRTGKKKRKEAMVLGARDFSDALDQVVAVLELPPVHLVAHDTGAEAALAWALRNAAKVASVTLVDAAPRSPSVPVWLLRVPVLGAFVANSDLAFRWLLRSCCFPSVTVEDAEDYGYLLRSSGGLQALLGTFAALNSSVDVAEWAGHSNLEGVPKQILWAGGWSEEWRREGERLAAAMPGAAFRFHRGSRWPQEDAAPEIADMIAQFVKSVPSHQTEAEALFKLGQNTRGSQGHHHHSHEHELGYMEGLGQAPGVSHGGWVL